MASDPLALVRSQIGARVADIQERGPWLSSLDLHTRMDAIRQMAAEHGMVALEGLARCTAQLALRPGHRMAMRTCLEHIDEALDSRSSGDCTTILAALAVRLR